MGLCARGPRWSGLSRVVILGALLGGRGFVR